MKLDKEGLDLIKQFEGLRLVVYKDIIGIPTVGYGHVTTLPVGTKITQEEADKLFLQDVKHFEDLANLHITAPVNQHQFNAFVSILFNVGEGNSHKDGIIHLKSGQPSTLLRKLNIGDYDGAALEFPKWDKAGGVDVPSLLKRRLKEQEIFRS